MGSRTDAASRAVVVKGEHTLKEPVRADRPADRVESDLADLGEVGLAELRRYRTPGPSRRLLEETRRPRLSALSGSNPGARAE
ncbi:hypothetical protein GTY60_32845 [Streptomyces sp. SID8367]|nr:hypothetical protein [Streptomyces sp. SID8367]